MKQLSFFLNLILRRRESKRGDIDFIGFEAFPRPTGATQKRTTSSADKRRSRSAAFSDQDFRKAA